jgi:hypothetical protein
MPQSWETTTTTGDDNNNATTHQSCVGIFYKHGTVYFRPPPPPTSSNGFPNSTTLETTHCLSAETPPFVPTPTTCSSPTPRMTSAPTKKKQPGLLLADTGTFTTTPTTKVKTKTMSPPGFLPVLCPPQLPLGFGSPRLHPPPGLDESEALVTCTAYLPKELIMEEDDDDYHDGFLIVEQQQQNDPSCKNDLLLFSSSSSSMMIGGELPSTSMCTTKSTTNAASSPESSQAILPTVSLDATDDDMRHVTKQLKATTVGTPPPPVVLRNCKSSKTATKLASHGHRGVKKEPFQEHKPNLRPMDIIRQQMGLVFVYPTRTNSTF